MVEIKTCDKCPLQVSVATRRWSEADIRKRLCHKVMHDLGGFREEKTETVDHLLGIVHTNKTCESPICWMVLTLKQPAEVMNVWAAIFLAHSNQGNFLPRLNKAKNLYVHSARLCCFPSSFKHDDI